MSDGMKSSIAGAIVGAVLTGIISGILFMAEKNTIERKTVETLAQYFESVEYDMSYDQVLKSVYEDFKTLENENENLKGELADLKVELDALTKQVNTNETNNETIKNAQLFADSNDYATALGILNRVENKTSEMEVLIKNYSQKYELYIINQVDTIKSNKQLDEASILVKEALEIIPNSQALKSKQQEIENSYPRNMIDTVPAYQSGGNTYKEYTPTKGGGTEYFTMGGVNYTYGMTFNADINIFDDVSWAVYNLNNQYNKMEFIVCHVDGTDNGGETSLQIFYDGILKEEIPLAPDMAPQSLSFDVSGVLQLKMQVHSSGNNGPLYGLGNPTLK